MRKLDEAHLWAVTHTDLDARSGHGGFCTPSYTELQRARCWLELRRPERAMEIYQATIPLLPVAGIRDRGMALSGLASAYVRVGEPEEAAAVAAEAVRIGQSTGSNRMLREVYTLGSRSPAVAHLLDQLLPEGLR